MKTLVAAAEPPERPAPPNWTTWVQIVSCPWTGLLLGICRCHTCRPDLYLTVPTTTTTAGAHITWAVG